MSRSPRTASQLALPSLSLAAPAVSSKPIQIPTASPKSPLGSQKKLWTFRKSIPSPNDTDQNSPSWDVDGYGILPPEPRFKLTELLLPIMGSMGSAPSYHSLQLDGGPASRREIPSCVSFTLECTAPVPPAVTFEVKDLSPALLQAGDYVLSMTWMAENGEFLDMAAARAIEYKFGKRVVSRTETNYIRFTKGQGPGSVVRLIATCVISQSMTIASAVCDQGKLDATRSKGSRTTVSLLRHAQCSDTSS